MLKHSETNAQGLFMCYAFCRECTFLSFLGRIGTGSCCIPFETQLSLGKENIHLSLGNFLVQLKNFFLCGKDLKQKYFVECVCLLNRYLLSTYYSSDTVNKDEVLATRG